MLISRLQSSSRSRLTIKSASLFFVRNFQPFNVSDSTPSALRTSPADLPSRSKTSIGQHQGNKYKTRQPSNKNLADKVNRDWGAKFTFQDFLDESSKTYFERSGIWNAKTIAMEKKRKLDQIKQSEKLDGQKARRVDRSKQIERLHGRKARKLSRKDVFLPEGSNEEILEHEVTALLAKYQPAERTNDVNGKSDLNIDEQTKAELFFPETIKPRYTEPAEFRQEVELEILEQSSTGDGLALNETKDHVFVIPFAVPGDRVLAKPWAFKGPYTQSDFIKVIRPSPAREGVTPKCKYFGKCGGCQFQMLPYEAQLEHKRDVVKKAYQAFSGLSEAQMPEPLSTFGSPLQYGYRTKLTPHFDTPQAFKKVEHWDKVPEIGFNIKGTSRVMDIEECLIGTEIIQEALQVERQRTADNIQSFRLGATLLIRETTMRTRKDTDQDVAGQEDQTMPCDPTALKLISRETIHNDKKNVQLRYEYDTFVDTKTYTSVGTSLACEYVTTETDSTTTPPTTKAYKFTNTAASFFQNNNSILGPFTSYIYGLCRPQNQDGTPSKIKYLLDAYSGSGLFTLTLSPLFSSSLGIDIDSQGIAAARQNAKANNVLNAGFIDADASALFADVPYPPDETLLVIDPPRKGCDRQFLKQLRRFAPARVIYVSCNVHTQARDVGILLNGFTGQNESWEEPGLVKYEIEMLRGFDFFPQTGHVEGVCVLNRVDNAVEAA